MHKKTFLKPIIKSAEFCSTCHKVGLPFALNHYKDFVRGQDHYNSYLLSGVSGHGARSFYYPPVAKSNCAECHMDLQASNDFGARDFDGKGSRQIHNHLFPGANTGVADVPRRRAGGRGAHEVPRGQEGPRRPLRPPRGGRDRRHVPRPAPARRSRRSSPAGSTWSRPWSGPSTWAIRSPRGRSTRTRSGSS